MNCKQGEMAWVVVPPKERQTDWGKALHMRIVTCEKLWCGHRGQPMWDITPTFRYKCERHGWTHFHEISGVADKVLRPIRGGEPPAEDEYTPVIRELDFV